MLAPSQVTPGAPMAQGPTLPWAPGTSRPLSEDALKQWQSRVERGVAKDKTYHGQWERGLQAYAKALNPKPSGGDEINALLGYRHVESRKAQLHYRTPEINLVPTDPTDQTIPIDVVLSHREKVLNYELGPDGADLQAAMHKSLVDLLAASGLLVTYLGYEQMGLPDPMTGMEIPIWSRRFITAVSSKKLVIPDDFYDTNFDASPWLSIKVRLPIAQAKRMKWAIPADFTGTGTSKSGESRYSDGHDAADASDPQCDATITWYKAYLYDEAVFNPELYRCLILVEGCEAPAWHVDSPFQSLTPEGQLTDDSMRGNPIHVGTIRDLIDSAHVPSDLVVGEQLQDELSKFRTGQMRSRRRRRPVTLVSDRLGQPTIEKIAENAGPVPVPDEFMGDQGQRAILVTQAATEPRDNYTAQQIIEHDWQSAMGTGDNQGGQFTKKSTTATEVRAVQGNANARAKMDEDRVRTYVVKLIRKFDAILQRTATPLEVQKILGQQGAMLWEQWRILPGRYVYNIQPDAGRYVDAAEYRVQKVNEYNLFRKDPMVNPAELLKQVLTALGYDASKIIQPQAEKPDPIKVSLSFNAEAALSNAAEMQLLLSMLQQCGYKVDPEMAKMLSAQAQLRAAVAAEVPPDQPHGGSADRTEPINKHSSERTGGVPGVGRVN